MDTEDVIVSTVEGSKNEPRKLSEYKPTNAPLSKAEIELDEARDTEHAGWAPRTTENIGDMIPLPENDDPLH